MRSLFRDRDFRLLWVGQGVSEVGTAVTVVALPLIAVGQLQATPFQVGLITAAGFGAWLVVGLPLGAWADRRRRRPLLIAADLGRAALIATVPVAAFAEVLTIAHLAAVALLTGALSVLFDVAYPAYLPNVVVKDRLVDANGKLFATESAAHIAGPGLGGALIQAVGAATTLLLDVVSFLVSAVTLWVIRAVEPPPPPESAKGRMQAQGEGAPPPSRSPQSLRTDLAEGLRYTFRWPFTRAILVGCALANLVFGGYTAVVVVFLYVSVGLGEAAIGALFAIGATGAVVGSLLAAPLAQRFGDARLAWLAPAFQVGFGLLIPFTASGWRLGLFAAGSFVINGCIGIFNVCVRAAIQASAPPHLLARTGASVRLFSRGALPVGALAGGALAAATDPRTAVAVLMAGLVLCPLYLRNSPLGRVRTVAELKGPADRVSA
jgi:MFS family permease